MSGFNLKIKTKVSGILNVKGVNKYGENINKKIRDSFLLSVKQTVKDTKEEMKKNAQNIFNVKKKAFLNTFTAKIYNQKKDKLPSILFYQKINWFKIHETGGVITGKMVVPFDNGSKKLGQKKWKELLASLKRNKQSFFKNINGKVILFAISNRNNSRNLNTYKKNFKTLKSINRLKSGTAIPIGVMVSTIRMKRKYNFTKIVANFSKNKLIDNFNNLINLNN